MVRLREQDTSCSLSMWGRWLKSLWTSHDGWLWEPVWRCLQRWRPKLQQPCLYFLLATVGLPASHSVAREKLVRPTGLEPAPSTLAGYCSSSRLTPSPLAPSYLNLHVESPRCDSATQKGRSHPPYLRPLRTHLSQPDGPNARKILGSPPKDAPVPPCRSYPITFKLRARQSVAMLCIL